MAISTKWAIQKVFTVRLFDLSTGANIGVLEDLKQSNFSTDGTVVYASGGAGNPQIIGFDHSKKASLSLQNAVFDFNTMGVQLGATPITGTNTNYVYTDIVTITTNAGNTKYTALGTAGSEIKYAYILNSDGSLGTQLTQSATPSAGKFSYTSGTKAIATFAGDVTSGSQIVVFYNATAGASTKTVTSKTNLFAKNVKVVIDGLVRDICTGNDYACQIIFNKAKASNKFDFTLTADGQPAVQNLELEALKSCGSDTLWSMIVLDTTETA